MLHVLTKKKLTAINNNGELHYNLKNSKSSQIFKIIL